MKRFSKQVIPNIAVDRYISRCIQEKRAAGQHNSADLCRTTRNWILKFQQGRPLYLHQITSGWVERFILFLQKHRLKPNSVNTYVSQLRAVYNRAIRDRLIPYPAEPPFGLITLKRGQTLSRAVKADSLSQLLSLKEKHPRLAETVDMSLFSFLACGMPFVDLAHLTPENIQGNELVYRRHKTGSLIRIGITEGMERIIRQYADPASPYLFPILPADRPVTHEGYKAILRQHNAKLRLLGEELHLPIRLTSYVFRHSWATEAQRKQTPVAMISQALGHTSEKTTRFYLATLEQPEMNRMNERIVGELDRLVVSCGFT